MQNLSTSPNYKNLWSKMTQYAVEPALRNQVAGAKTRGTRRNRNTRSSRSCCTRSAVGGGGSRTSNRASFVKAWTDSISNQVKRNQHKRKRSHRRSGGAQHRRRSSTKRRGGFIRGGSVQHFPADLRCLAQANRIAKNTR